MRWGLIPPNSATGLRGKPLINARAESVAKVPVFRAAYRQRRCLVPTDGFFEWTDTNGGRQPYLFRRRDDAVFCFAGLWERWQEPQGGASILSFTILTTQASELVRPIHHRMPVILTQEQVPGWLGEEQLGEDALAQMAGPGGDEDFVVYPVSKRVNTPVNDDPGCIEPVDEAAEGGPIGRLI